MAGRPRLSPETHKLRGNRPHYVPGETPDAPVLVAAGRPPVPKHLTGKARQEFKRICQMLERRGHLTVGDYYAAAGLAEIVVRWVKAKATLAERGLMIVVQWTDKNGDLRTSEKLSPLVNACSALESQILRYSKALGLSPDSRAKVQPASSAATEPKKPLTLADTHPWLFDDSLPRPTGASDAN